MNLRFVTAGGGCASNAELLEALADVTAQLGATVSAHVGVYPSDDDQSVYVVIPEDYFPNIGPDDMPTPTQRARSIGFVVAPPGTPTFTTAGIWASCLGATLAADEDAIEALRQGGISAQRFVLGYSPVWDKWHGDSGHDRSVDIAYLDSPDVRRDHLLCEQARVLGEWRTVVGLPLEVTSPTVARRRTRCDHLADSRVLLSLRGAEGSGMGSLAVAQAMSNGCVLVGEPGPDHGPLLAGVHVAFARGPAAADVAAALLRHPDRLSAMRDAAYSLVRDHLSMDDSAAELLELAGGLFGGHSGPPSPVPTPAADLAPRSTDRASPPELAQWAVPIPADGRRALATALRARTAVVVEIEQFTGEPSEDRPAAVDAIVVATGDGVALGLTMSSLALQDMPVHALVGHGSDVPEVSFARGRVRNALLRRGAEDMVLVIDPGQELFPRAVRRLVEALTANPSVAAVSPMVADPRSGTVWPARPGGGGAVAPVLGPPLLIRRRALDQLGGYSENPSLEGYEDSELWRRLVDGGGAGLVVPDLLATGAPSGPPPYGIARLMPRWTIEALARAGQGDSGKGMS